MRQRSLSLQVFHHTDSVFYGIYQSTLAVIGQYRSE